MVEYSFDDNLKAREAKCTMPLNPTTDFLNAVDMKFFAQEVTQNIPTLVHIEVFIDFWLSSETYWEVIQNTECSHKISAKCDVSEVALQ